MADPFFAFCVTQAVQYPSSWLPWMPANRRPILLEKNLTYWTDQSNYDP
jgi:hypothetical protein